MVIPHIRERLSPKAPGSRRGITTPSTPDDYRNHEARDRRLLRPLGITVFAGLSLGTLLTLFVVPCLYLTLHDLFRWNPFAARKKQGSDEAPPRKRRKSRRRRADAS
jgi:hypothetical protein